MRWSWLRVLGSPVSHLRITLLPFPSAYARSICATENSQPVQEKSRRFCEQLRKVIGNASQTENFTGLDRLGNVQAAPRSGYSDSLGRCIGCSGRRKASYPDRSVRADLHEPPPHCSYCEA